MNIDKNKLDVFQWHVVTNLELLNQQLGTLCNVIGKAAGTIADAQAANWARTPEELHELAMRYRQEYADALDAAADTLADDTDTDR
ncbi:hypothetical protein [Bifidobacterium canis]|uniref:Uncharacterized protein n=1 Tax=Bifidobacterium canis TaxID=2610880 RepID=A0A7K1J4M7_9BIFI|nr:hypothetical protein [Bifidobacterium canis]MUH59440.1 hypothetical protein [Bifidobacterium canis]